MPMVEGGGRPQSARSPSSDGIYSSDDEESNSVLPNARGQRLMYPIPQSHWFPRAIAFRVYAGARAARQQGGVNASPRVARHHVGAPRLHIQVTRPVHSASLVCCPSCVCPGREHRRVDESLVRSFFYTFSGCGWVLQFNLFNHSDRHC